MTADSTKPALGASLADDTTAVWVNWSAEGGSMFAAGVSSGDRIFAVDGIPVTTVDSLDAIIRRKAVGETVQLDIVQRTVRRTIPMKLVARPSYSIMTYEKAGRTVTPEMKRFRESWLGAKASQ